MRERKQPIPAAAVAFVRDSAVGIEVYLSRRPAHFRHFPGAFVFPGGRLDVEDKDLRDTACREVKEEIGVDIDPEQLVPLREIDTSPHFGPVFHMLTFVYPAWSDFITQLNEDEVDEEVWITAPEAIRRLDLPYQIMAGVYTISSFATVADLLRALGRGTINKDYWF